MDRPTVASNLAKINEHEKVCAERYLRIDEKLADLKAAGEKEATDRKADIKAINDNMSRATYFMLATLVTSLGSLVGMVFLLLTKVK